MKKAVVKAMEEGQTEKQFAKGVYGTLDKLGWFGVRTDVDPATGKEVTHDIAPWRLELIARQNTQNAYQASHWQAMQDNRESRPWLQYVAVLESHTCETCESLDKLVLPIDDPFWETHYPPNHFNCRCSTRALTDEQKNERVADGRSVKPGEMKAVTVEQQVSASAGHVTQTTGYEFNKGGKTFKSVPSAGFDTNVGMQGPRLVPPTDTAPPHAPTPAPAHAPRHLGKEPVPVAAARPTKGFVVESPTSMENRQSPKPEQRESKPLPKDPLELVSESVKSIPDEMSGIVKKAIETSRFEYHDKKVSEYDQATKTVYLSKKQMRSARNEDKILHEIAHHMDTFDSDSAIPTFVSRPVHSVSEKFAEAFEKHKTSVLKNKRINSKIAVGITSDHLVFDPVVSDLLGALTRNEVVGLARHSTSYYRKSPTADKEEVFANMFTLYSRKNRKAWEFVESNFPRLASEFKAVIAKMQKAIEEGYK